MATRELPEIRFLNQRRQMEKQVKKSASEQDKKSTVRKRQIDRNIYLMTKELSDIQTRTPSPSRKGSSPRIACSPSTPSTTQGSGATPRITVSLAAGPPDSGDSDHLHSPRSNVNSSDCDSDSDTHLVHLRARTRHNLLLSGKLSRSLEAMDERRGQSPHPPPSASKERRAYRPVSSRSMEDLEKAATVLRFTEHEEEVQQLLSSVLPPKGVHHGKT